MEKEMANTNSKAVEITFGEHVGKMAATFPAVAAIEQATGVALITLAQQLVAGTLPIRTQALMVAEFLRAGGEESVTIDGVGKHLIAAGARSDAVIAPLGDVLRLALLGDDALEGDQQR